MNSKNDHKSDRQDLVLPDLPPTEKCLPLALMRAREKVMVMMRQMLASSGISEQQWRVLRVLSENGPLVATHLGERTGLLLPSLTRIVQTMETGGLLTRSVDANDRRRQLVRITAAGQAVIAANQEAAGRISDQFIAHLGVQRYDTLLEALELLERIDTPDFGKRP